jgi:branched-chain amino acid aminotransferase
MSVLVSIDGRVAPGDEARISVFDNGFMFGDGAYETLRTYDGRPFHLGRHLRRLRASVARLGFAIPLSDQDMATRLDALLAQADHGESYVRIVATRGVGDVSYNFERVTGPTIVMVVKPLETLPVSAYTQGLDVVVASIRRNSPSALDPAIKSINLLNNILAVREAQTRNAAEAILLNERGEIAEGASSNVFVVSADVVLTPPLSAGLLAGITRGVVLELAPTLGLEAREATLRPRDLGAAAEVFITSSLREIAPVRAIDGHVVGSGGPGPITLRVRAAFREYAPAHCGLTS